MFYRLSKEFVFTLICVQMYSEVYVGKISVYPESMCADTLTIAFVPGSFRCKGEQSLVNCIVRRIVIKLLYNGNGILDIIDIGIHRLFGGRNPRV